MRAEESQQGATHGRAASDEDRRHAAEWREGCVKKSENEKVEAVNRLKGSPRSLNFWAGARCRTEREVVR